MLLIAHVGHWLLWVLYAVPIAIVLGSIAITMARDRREGRTDESPTATEPPDTGWVEDPTAVRRPRD